MNEETSHRATPATVGDAASSFISSELTVERTRKESLPERAMKVITTSGALVTLLLGLAALITKSDAYVITQSSKWLLSGAALTFVASSALAIGASLPSKYLQVDPSSLHGLVSELTWLDPGAEAAREIVVAHLVELDDTRSRNHRTAWLIAVAMGLEVFGVLLTASFVISTLVGA